MNFNDRLLQGCNLGRKMPDLHGHAQLDFMRNGKIVHRVERDNTITNWILYAISKGNFHDFISPDKIMPIKQWFEGCLLTDVPNDPDLMMIAGNANITAQAGNNAYSSTNQKRGSFNTTESGNIETGYRFVWDWATNQGNGDIASVCLTRHQLGIADFSSSRLPEDEGLVVERIHRVGTAAYDSISETLAKCNILDYEKGIGYAVEYASNTITITEVYICSKEINKIVAPLLDGVTKATHEIAQTVQSYAIKSASVSYTGDAIHLLTWNISGSNTVVYDYKILLADWTCVENTYTFQGVKFSEQPTAYRTRLCKDVFPVINNYLYAFCDYNNIKCAKIAKCNLESIADVSLVDNPEYTIASQNTYEVNGTSLILPNGDWYKFGNYNVADGTISNGLYCHNGQFYLMKYVHHNIRFNGLVGAQGNNYGTILMNSSSTISPTNYFGLCLNVMYPYVSTVANLDASVRKTADLTMKLSYEITEV